MDLCLYDLKKIRSIVDAVSDSQNGINLDGLLKLSEEEFKQKDILEAALNDPELIKDYSRDRINGMINYYTKHLLYVFVTLNNESEVIDYACNRFVEQYVDNESNLEGINHSSELSGLSHLYRYIHSNNFEIGKGVNSCLLTTLQNLHYQLCINAPHPEYGKYLRNIPVYIGQTEVPATQTEIINAIMKLEPQYQKLIKDATMLKNHLDVNSKLVFFEEVIKFGAKIIQIQPFMDGNKRTTRCFMNALFEKAGLPPVYIKKEKRNEYHVGLENYLNNNDSDKISNLYKNMLCDSIKELVLDPFKLVLSQKKIEEYNKLNRINKKFESNLNKVFQNTENTTKIVNK